MHSRADISRLLDQHGLAPRRELGQNFVVDANIVRKIARLAAVGPGDHVVEIGAGLGSLTLALATSGAEVLAVEVDHGVAAVLRSVVADHPNVTVVEADAMRTDWTALLESSVSRHPGGPQTLGSWTLVANLPYNVATPLVCDLLDHVPAIERMLVMVQREAAERLCAGPGSAVYGAVSVKVAYWAVARMVASVPATVFLPRPNVESALVEIRRRPAPIVDAPPGALFELVRTAFNQRRKMLRRSLAATVAPYVFAAAGIDSSRRPEDLDVVEWAALTRAWLAAA